MKSNTISKLLIVPLVVAGTLGSINKVQAESALPNVTEVQEQLQVQDQTQEENKSHTVLQSSSFFSDVGEENWAKKYIQRMSLRGIVTGYNDNTFRPNQEITQLEAVTMLVRYLGYEDEAKSFDQSNLAEDSQLLQLIKDIPTWAKGSVAVAHQLQLFDEAAGFKLEPSKPASRAWVSKLLVDGIKKANGQIVASQNSAVFNDQHSIPTWAYEAITEAVNAKIITGYDDGTFRATVPITRAQITALMSRSEKYLNESIVKNISIGTIEQSNTDSIILSKGNDQLKRVYFAGNAFIYLDTKRITADQLKVGDQIEAILDRAGRIIYLDVVAGSSLVEKTVEGSIYHIDNLQQKITLENEQGTQVDFSYKSDTEVVKNGAYILPSQLQKYDKVKVKALGEQIIRIEVLKEYNNNLMAEVVSINLQKKIVTVMLADGKLEVFNLIQVPIKDQKGKVESLESLTPGDVITLQYEADKLIAIQLAKFTIDQTFIGKIEQNQKQIEIEVGGTKVPYIYSDDIKIIIKGYTNPKMSDVWGTDKVRVVIQNNKVVELEVLNRSRDYYIYTQADTSAKAIKVQSVKDQKYSYITYIDQAIIVRNGQALHSVTSLNANERIAVTLIDNQIYMIETANYTVARVQEINTKEKWIRLKNSSNQEYYVTYGEETVVKINGVLSSLDKLSVNDYISYYVINDHLLELSK